jgi:hypothetical protein
MSTWGETLDEVPICQTAWRHTPDPPDDRTDNIHCTDNLTSYIVILIMLRGFNICSRS